MLKKVKFDTIYLDMKKIILVFILILFSLFVPKILYGQDIGDNIPGLTCGVANDVTGKDKCCNVPKVVDCSSNETLVGVANLASNLAAIIPGAGFLSRHFSDALDNCKKLKDFTDNNINPGACISGEPSVGDFSNPSCKCIDTKATNPNQAMIDMCSKYLTSSINTNELKNCFNCASSDGIWTGMGCLPLDIKTLINGFILTTGIGLGGGFALLCIIYAAFMMQSSQGNPEKLKKAQEMITSCIMGLMLIIFSVFIMRLIGVNILRIPGFQ